MRTNHFHDSPRALITQLACQVNCRGKVFQKHFPGGFNQENRTSQRTDLLMIARIGDPQKCKWQVFCPCW